MCLPSPEQELLGLVSVKFLGDGGHLLQETSASDAGIWGFSLGLIQNVVSSAVGAYHLTNDSV